MERLELSIVIPVYNNWWLTARCLRALGALRDRNIEFETIVVDNASNDETPHAIEAFPWVRYLRHVKNENFAGACNAGVRAAQTPLTLLLNNDAYPLGDALTPLVRAFDRPGVAIAGGALFFEDGVTQAAGMELLTNAHWHYSCRNLPPTLRAVIAPRDALAVSGAAMAVRTRWFNETGGFDESFINGFEDVDFCMRARDQGYAIAYVPSARFAHYEAATEGRFARELENERRFYQRWSPRLTTLARTARGNVGAIAMRAAAQRNRLSDAALEDLEKALRGFGHPVVHGEAPCWRRFDRRFRDSASLGCFTEAASPGVTIQRSANGSTIRTRGAVDFEVPWLPCASPHRLAPMDIARTDDGVIGVIGNEDDVREFCATQRGYATVPMTDSMLLDAAEIRVACVVHLGLSDATAFGNVLLAQAGLPAIVAPRDELRAIFASDVAVICDTIAIDRAVAEMFADPARRLRYGETLAADARRRFSPRRSAIRIVDLLCAARFGLERPAPAFSDSPI